MLWSIALCCCVHHSSSSFVIHHSSSSFIIHHLSFIVCHSSFITINSSNSRNPHLCRPGLVPRLQPLPTQQPASIYDGTNEGSGHIRTPLCLLGQIPHHISSIYSHELICRLLIQYPEQSWGADVHQNLVPRSSSSFGPSSLWPLCGPTGVSTSSTLVPVSFWFVLVFVAQSIYFFLLFWPFILPFFILFLGSVACVLHLFSRNILTLRFLTVFSKRIFEYFLILVYISDSFLLVS